MGKAKLLDVLKERMPGIDHKYMNEQSALFKSKIKDVFDEAGRSAEFDDFVNRYKMADKRMSTAPIGIQTDNKSVLGILNDGKFKNSFELGKSNGSSNLMRRGSVEDNMFGYKRIPDAERPVYGWRANDSKICAKIYGDNTFYPKKDVNKRSSYSTNDSFHIESASRPGMEDYQGIVKRNFFEPYARTPDEKIKALNDKVKGMTDRNPGYSLAGYFESQIHGGLSLDDIDKLEFYPKNKEELEQAKDAAAKYGFQLKVMDTKDGRMKCVVNCPDK